MTEEEEISDDEFEAQEPVKIVDAEFVGNQFKELEEEEVQIEPQKSDVDKQIEALVAERDAVPKPWKGENAAKRRELKKKIDELGKTSEKAEAKVNKIVAENMDPEEMNAQKERYKNLAENIGYKNKNFSKMSNQKFMDEKQKILQVADAYFHGVAEAIYSMAILTGAFADKFECLNGISGDLVAKKEVMLPMIKKILIEDGMKAIPKLEHLSNPYVMLGIAFGGITVNRYAINKRNKKVPEIKVEKKTESTLKPSQTVSETSSTSISA